MPSQSTQDQGTAAHGPGNAHPEFREALGLFDSIMIVVGVMVGSGIFIVSAEIGRQVGSAGWLLVAWAIACVLTVAGALSYGELAAMMPKAGGMYIYLREAFSPLMGFLYGWTLLTVIQTGTIAAVAIAFARYSGVLFPSIREDNYLIAPIHLLPGYAISLSATQLLALAIILIATVVNSYGVQWGKLIQNVFTVAKLSGIAMLLAVGAFVLFRHPGVFRENFSNPWRPISVSMIRGVDATTVFGLFVALCVSQTGALFSADAWHNVTFVAAEVRNPKRNLPLSLGLGASIVIVLYLLCNAAYLAVLPMHAIQTAPDDRVASLMIDTVIPGIGKLGISLLIMVSTFGTVNAMTLAGARACFAMARDGLFFRKAGLLNGARVPGWALALQCVWSLFLVLPRTYNSATHAYGNLYSNLLDYVISAEMIFYILTIAGLFLLRRTRPDAPRPYRAWGYPWLPAIYILGGSIVLIVLFGFRPATTWPGLLIIASGVPIYFYLRRRSIVVAS